MAKIKFDRPKLGKYAADVKQHQQALARAVTGAFRDGAKELQQQTRTAITAAGLGPRFARQFKAFAFPRRQFSLSPVIRGWHARAFKRSKIGRYANIFARGGTIHGKPLLWLPLPTAPRRIAGQMPTPTLYEKEIGPLVRLRGAHGPPMLGGQSLRAVEGRRATVAQLKNGARNARERAAGRKGRNTVTVPMFIGLPSVRIPKKLNMDAIFTRVRNDLPKLFDARLRQAAGKRNG